MIFLICMVITTVLLYLFIPFCSFYLVVEKSENLKLKNFSCLHLNHLSILYSCVTCAPPLLRSSASSHPQRQSFLPLTCNSSFQPQMLPGFDVVALIIYCQFLYSLVHRTTMPCNSCSSWSTSANVVTVITTSVWL